MARDPRTTEQLLLENAELALAAARSAARCEALEAELATARRQTMEAEASMMQRTQELRTANAELRGQQAELTVLNRGLVEQAEDLQTANLQLSGQSAELARQRDELATLHAATERRADAVEAQVVRQDEELRLGISHRARLVTERQAAQRRARASEQQTQSILDSAGEGILGLDPAGVVTFANPAAAKMLGLAPARMLGQDHRPLLGHASSAGLAYPPGAGPIDAALRAGEGHAASRDFFRRDGAPFPVEYVVTPMRERDQVLGAVVVFRDVTERREQERQRDQLQAEWSIVQDERIAMLEHANAQKQQFLGILSHELRTPINAVMGFGSILEDEIPGSLNPEQGRLVGRILIAAEALLALVDDLLDMSRIQAGQFTVDVAPLALLEVVEASLAPLTPAAAASGIDVRNELASDLPRVLGDASRVGQVLRNLVGNAIKFTQPGGVIAVKAHAEASFMTIQVADDGPGIALADQATLFDAFTQVDMSSTREKGGVGLGLTISRGLVEAQGGRLGVVSAPGRGSTFWFTLPLA